jgi:fumarate reductase subunit C
VSITKSLRMRFKDSNNRLVTFTVNPPVMPVNLADVEALMDLIIETNTFYTYTGGSIVTKVDVKLHTEEVEPLTDFE